jgi:sugar phosphate isomerase/epimerase
MEPSDFTLGYLSIADVGPLTLIEVAQEAGFTSLGLRITARKPQDPWAYPVVGNPQQVAQLKKALSDGGMRLSNISTFHIYPDTPLSDLMPVIEASHELGASYIVACAYDPDVARLTDFLGRYAQIMGEAKMRIAFEVVSYSAYTRLDQAVALLGQVRSPHLGLMLDPLHLVRGGGRLSDVADLNKSDICFAQICDAPLIKPNGVDASTEAKSMRFYPGEAELPLATFLRDLGPDIEREVELPVWADKDLMPLDRARTIHQKSKAYFQRHQSLA